MKRILILIFSILVLCGCKKFTIVEYDTAEYLVFQNDSSHNIIITRTDFSTDSWIKELPETITLPSKESYKLDVLSIFICDSFGKVIFDGNLEVDYLSLPKSSYNITSPNNYTLYKEDKYTFFYTYTFTDADYQFALENGTKLEL